MHVDENHAAAVTELLNRPQSRWRALDEAAFQVSNSNEKVPESLSETTDSLFNWHLQV
jgi:hypothetical protein